MSRYLGPRLRIVRRLGYLIGLTRKKPSTKLLNPDARRGIRKVIPPGQHGRSKSFKKAPYESNEYDFLIRLKLKQRIRYHYGITEKQLVNYIRQARKIKGSTGRVLLRLLEMRLDNTVFRLHMAPTIRAARQLINHGHIYVNNKKVSIPSYSCKPKDIITPAPKKRSIQLLNHYLTELDQEKSRFKNLLKILKFGKKGLLNNTKTLEANKEKNNQKNWKPNTIISLRIQKAGVLEGQGIGFLGKNLVIVQPLFGNIKNYLGKSLNICIYLKRENIFYGYPTKPFNIKMRYSKLINSIDAIQYFGRKKTLQNTNIQNKNVINSIKSNEKNINTIKNLNQLSSAIILLGGANIFRNKLGKNSQIFKQNASDNVLVRIEAASFGNNQKYALNRKRQLNQFILKKTRDTNPILFREKFLYSRRNRRFVGINHIFYVKTILKSIEQNPTNKKNISNFYEQPKLENKTSILIKNDSLNRFFYSKLNKVNQNASNNNENIINKDDKLSNRLLLKNNSSLLNNIVFENAIKLRKYFFAKIKKQNLVLETKLSLIYLCVRKEKYESNKDKLQTSTLKLNKNYSSIKQKTLKSLLSQITINKKLNKYSFWKILYLFSKISLRQKDLSRLNLFFNNSFKNSFLQKFSQSLIDKQKDVAKKHDVYSIKAFVFFSKIFDLIKNLKTQSLISNSNFQAFIKKIKQSLSFLILLQKSILSLLNNQKQDSSLNFRSKPILEYYKNQEFNILKSFKTSIETEINFYKFEKLSNTALIIPLNNKNQYGQSLKLNTLKQELNFYLSLLANKKIVDSNLSYEIDIYNYYKNLLNHSKFINTSFIYTNYIQNKENLLKIQLLKSKFQFTLLINLLKKTTIFSNVNLDQSTNFINEIGQKIYYNFLQKQILQKYNLIKIQFNFKKYLLDNFVNNWKNQYFISSDQNQHILLKLNYYLSQEKYTKYKNLLGNLIEKNSEMKWNNENLVHKIKNSISLEKTFQKISNQKLEYFKKLEEFENLGLVFNLSKNNFRDLLNNQIQFVVKLINFEQNYLITKTISTTIKNKIKKQNSLNIQNILYTTKLNSFLALSQVKEFNEINLEKINSKLEQQIILQKIKQKKKFLVISKTYENMFFKNMGLLNFDENGKYLMNYVSELFDLKERKFFQTFDKTKTYFYPLKLNRKLVKEKLVQISTNWLNYVLLFNKIDILHRENHVTQKEHSTLIYQTKQFVIKDLILNKNKFFIGPENFFKLRQKNIFYFINKIKNTSLNYDSDFKFFTFGLYQINQKYNQLINILTNKSKFFLNQSFVTKGYIDKLNKYKTVNPMDLTLNNSHTSTEMIDSNLGPVLNSTKQKEYFDKIYNRILKNKKFKIQKFYNKLSSSLIGKLSLNIADWIDNISVIKLKKGLNILLKQQLLTKPSYKLFLSLILKFKQDGKKITENSLMFNSVLFFKTHKIYQQKRIQSFMNLLVNFNSSLNYINLNNELNYSINENVQKELNKKSYYQFYTHTIDNQEKNQIIKKIFVQITNKLEILEYFKILDVYEFKQCSKVINLMKNEIMQLNTINNSINQTFYKTTKLINHTIKFWDIFIYYHLKSSKKRNKNNLLFDQLQKSNYQRNYFIDDLLSKLCSKLNTLKQQNLLTFSKYEKLVDQLTEQPLTKHFILNFINEVNRIKVENLIELKYIHSNSIFYCNVLFFKFITSLNVLRENYAIKQNDANMFINQIKNQLNKNFQKDFQYILYLSKFNSLQDNGLLSNEERNKIEKNLPNIINNIKNYSKRSIKLQKRLKYGFINYRKYESLTQNLLKNLQLKIQKLISHTNFLEQNDRVSFSKIDFNNFKKNNNSVKKMQLLQEKGSEKLQKLMYFALNSTIRTNELNKQKFEWDFFVLNYFKKELQYIQMVNICKEIELNFSYLKQLKNETKTKIISQTRKISNNYNEMRKKISKNDQTQLVNNINQAVLSVETKEIKIQKNLLQKFKISIIKQFLLEIKKMIFNNFTKNTALNISQKQLLIVNNFPIDKDNYFKKLKINLHFTIFNNINYKKHAYKIYETTTFLNTNKNLANNSPEVHLVNNKILNILKRIQKSYKFKILLDIQNKNYKLLNINRIYKLKSHGLYSLNNKRSEHKELIKEKYKKLENILLSSNYSNVSLIIQYLNYEINIIKKFQSSQQFNNYLTNFINFVSNKLNFLKNNTIVSSKTIYQQIKNTILKTIFSNLLISANLENLSYLIKNDLISNKLYKTIKKFFYRKKMISRLQNILLKLKHNSFEDSSGFNNIFPKIITILDRFNDLKLFNLISKNQYFFLQTQMEQILKFEHYISRLSQLKKQGILTKIQYNQILLKIQQKIVQKVREQKIVQKFKQYIDYVYQTKNNDEAIKNQNIQKTTLNFQYKKIISLNQGKWAIVAIKEFYQQNLLTTSQYNEIMQKLEKNIRKKVQIAKLFSNNRNFSQFQFSIKYKSNITRKQNQKTLTLFKSLPHTWTKNILKELRKQSILSNKIFAAIEKQIFNERKQRKINDFLNESTKEYFIKETSINHKKEQPSQSKGNLRLLKDSINNLLDYKKQLIQELSMIDTTSIYSGDFFDLSYIKALKNNETISQKEYNKLRIYNKLAKTRLIRLKILQKAPSFNNLQFEKLYKKIIQSYLIIQYQYIQRLLRNKQYILQEVYNGNKKNVDKKIKKHLNKIKISKKATKTSNSLFSLMQEVLSQLPISSTNKNQSTYRQRIIYNRLYSKLRSDDILIKKWKQILTTIFKKRLTPPLDIPPHLELRRIQISLSLTTLTKKNKKNLIIPVGTVLSLPSRKTAGVSVLERLIVEYYSRN